MVALAQAIRILIAGQEAEEAYRVVRTVFGRSILLGLEFLVAADIIRTVAVEPSLENVGALGLIVLIQDVPELLARGRDRRHQALAAYRAWPGSSPARVAALRRAGRVVNADR